MVELRGTFKRPTAEAMRALEERYGRDIFTTADYRELLDEPLDAVFVTTPDFLHEEHAVAALRANEPWRRAVAADCLADMQRRPEVTRAVAAAFKGSAPEAGDGACDQVEVRIQGSVRGLRAVDGQIDAARVVSHQGEPEAGGEAVGEALRTYECAVRRARPTRCRAGPRRDGEGTEGPQT